MSISPLNVADNRVPLARIPGSIFMRPAPILAGATLIAPADWLFWLFGAFPGLTTARNVLFQLAT